ncbi:DUF2877 domain-containing protein [Spirillospora albida]|uniref:oxamate carbamoyltransferase subunit AllH family protein n=1 Tax=Spirillospora albida TaxID=58123 RepID=UPI0004BF3BA4|nr:DUF2877 domain-containing protein [Spirillospora albida]
MTPLVRDTPAPPGRPLPATAPRAAVGAAPPTIGAAPPAVPAIAGAASLALRPLLEPPRRPARVAAVFPSAVLVEARGGPEPRVLALVASDAGRPPNAVVIAAPRRDRPFQDVREGADAALGEGRADIGGLHVRIRRWWDPRPALGPLPPAVLARGVRALETALTAAGMTGGGLAGHPDPLLLADRCAAGDLAGAVEAAERIVGLGPGLTPSGDDVLAGLLLALRHVGGAVRGGGDTARWLADWLGAAVTADAGTRTTAPAATLLHCAAAGGAGAEVAAVLRGVAGSEAPSAAARRLLAVGRTSGADLAWGVLAGCRAALALARRPGAGRVPA